MYIYLNIDCYLRHAGDNIGKEFASIYICITIYIFICTYVYIYIYIYTYINIDSYLRHAGDKIGKEFVINMIQRILHILGKDSQTSAPRLCQ